MKIIKNIINWTIWGLVALYLLLMLVIHIPACQTFLGNKIAEAIEEKLATKVSIGRVDLGFLNRVIIDDLLIYDQQQKQMLKAARLSVRMDILPLAEGRIRISSAQLFGAHANLYKQTAEAKPNFQFVVDSLASKDTTSHTPLDLHINSLIIRRSSVAFNQLDAPETSGLFNAKHLHVNDLSVHLILKALTDDSLDVNVKRLGLSEQSGLDIDNLSFKLKAGRTGATLSDFLLAMPSTQVKADSIKTDYQMNGNQLVLSSLRYRGVIEDTYITHSDLRCFHAPLKNSQKPVHLSTTFSGTSDYVDIPQLHLYTDAGELDLQVSGRVGDLRQAVPSCHADIANLTLSETMIDFLQKTIPEIPRQVANIGSVQLNGLVSRTSDGGMSAQVKTSTGLGSLAVDFLKSAAGVFHGTLETDGINLGRLLDNEQLGILATNISLDGTLADKQKSQVSAQGLVSQFDFNGYSFTNIGLNGTYSDERISGFIKSSDPNLEAELEGEVERDKEQSSISAINLRGTVNRLSPKALKLTDQWDDAVFSANLEANFRGKSLNDAQGTVHVTNFMMAGQGQEPYRIDNLHMTSGFDEQQHYVSLVSDFAKAELRGDFEYSTLAQSVTNYIGSALPTLPGLPAVSTTANNNFALTLQVFKTDWLQRLAGINLDISHPMMLTARVNDYDRTINLESQMPDFSYNGARYLHGDIHISSPLDSIKCRVALDKLMDNGHLLGIDLEARANNNDLNTTLTWNNHNSEEAFEGKLNLAATLYRNLLNQQEAHIRVQPSHIVLNGSTWNVEPSDILYRTDHLLIDQFLIHNGQQHIMIEGKASANDKDSLQIDLNGVEVAYILNLVNFHSVEFSGEATGTATIMAPFGSFKANADLDVAHFKFENGRMGTLHANAIWNKEREQIDIHAVADDGPDAQTLINGYVSPTFNTIDLGIQARGTHIDFMHNFTSSFLSAVGGQAEGAVRLAGTLDNINLTGQLVVNGEATVTPLNTTYTLRNDTVTLIPDDILLRQIPLYDKYGNRGTLSGGIHHQHLTNLSYDLSVSADNLLAYDFKDFSESTFYGTVYASGDVDIHGRSGEVTINCNVTPQKNSVFVYNASSPDAITNQEFIEWGPSHHPTPITHHLSPNTQHPSPITADIPTDIYINFLINCTPEATLRLLMDSSTNDYITLNGDGTIRATFYNKGPFNMFGTYTVDHGTYGITIQNIIKKNFTFNRGGTIIFGGDPYNAALNLQAVYTVNGVSLSDLNIGNSFASNTIRVNCLMNIGGQPNAPQVDFDLEMPTVNADEQQMVRSIINGQQEMNQQVLYLLGIGRFYNQGQNNAGTNQPDQTSLAMQSFLSGTLSTQINSLLSTVIKNDNWNFGANISTGNEGWHNAEYEGLISGRMLNNRLLLNGQFGYRDNATQANPSFIGDFDIQYLLYPNGNLALKVYNQTNDRYFTKSSLNTQGIGLIMKKDFNGLRDLFAPKKKKKRK